MLMLMSVVETGQMSAAETGQMSAVETRQMSTIETGLCPFLRLVAQDMSESHGRSRASGTGPAAQNPTTNPKSFHGTPPLQFQQDGYKIDTAM